MRDINESEADRRAKRIMLGSIPWLIGLFLGKLVNDAFTAQYGELAGAFGEFGGLAIGVSGSFFVRRLWRRWKGSRTKPE